MHTLVDISSILNLGKKYEKCTFDHLFFGAQNFHENWNVVPYCYYNGKVLISDQWQSYKRGKLKKLFFTFFSNPI